MTITLYQQVFDVCSDRSQSLLNEARQQARQCKQFDLNAAHVLLAVLANPSAYADVVHELESFSPGLTYASLKSTTYSVLGSYVQEPVRVAYDESIYKTLVWLIDEHQVSAVSGATGFLQPVDIVRAALQSGSTVIYRAMRERFNQRGYRPEYATSFGRS